MYLLIKIRIPCRTPHQQPDCTVPYHVHGPSVHRGSVLLASSHHIASCSQACDAKATAVQVKLCRRILRALASNSQPQQQEREAVTLLKASLDPQTLLTTPSMQDYEACLETVLFHSHRLLPATVGSLLGCFHLDQYARQLLEEESGEAAQVEVEGSGWAREGTAKVSG